MQHRSMAWVAILVGAVSLLAACQAQSADRRTSSGAAAPRLGAQLSASESRARSAPARPMDDLERQVNRDLGARMLRSGLHLEHVECPRWDGSVPTRLTCRAWLDGLVSHVRVRLARAGHSRAVDFDARLVEPVVTTAGVEESVRRSGRSQPDCGERAVFRARPGLRIVCRVRAEKSSRPDYVVATLGATPGRTSIARLHQPAGAP